jgi:HK97 gp10 family phage protein
MATRRRSVIGGNRNSLAGGARKGFQIEGLAEIQEKLGKIVNNVNGKKALAVYLDGGKILRDQARQNAPYDEGRESGIHLRDAIFVDGRDHGKPSVLVGVNFKQAPHAHWVEYGNVRTPAHPYFRPALTQTGAQVGSTIKNGLLKVIDDATK